MSETTLQVDVPSTLLRLGLDRSEIQRRITEWLVLSLYSEGHISPGRAARLLNMNRIEFLSLLRTRGIAYINYTPDELEDELAAVEALQPGKAR